MYSRISLFIVAILAVTGQSVLAEEVLVATGQANVRTTGAPFRNNVPIPAWPGHGTIILYNGGIDGTKPRVSSARVWYNDQLLASPSSFNQLTTIIKRELTTTFNSTLSFELASAPGSEVAYEIYMTLPYPVEHLSQSDFIAFDRQNGNPDTLDWVESHGFAFDKAITYSATSTVLIASFRNELNRTLLYVIDNKNPFGLVPYVVFYANPDLLFVTQDGGVSVSSTFRLSHLNALEALEKLVQFSAEEAIPSERSTIGPKPSPGANILDESMSDECLSTRPVVDPCHDLFDTQLNECVTRINEGTASWWCSTMSAGIIGCLVSTKGNEAFCTPFVEWAKDECITELAHEGLCLFEPIACSRECFSSGMCGSYHCKASNPSIGSDCNYSGPRCTDSTHDRGVMGKCREALPYDMLCCPSSEISECKECFACDQSRGCVKSPAGTACVDSHGVAGTCDDSAKCAAGYGTFEYTLKNLYPDDAGTVPGGEEIVPSVTVIPVGQSNAIPPPVLVEFIVDGVSLGLEVVEFSSASDRRRVSASNGMIVPNVVDKQLTTRVILTGPNTTTQSVTHSSAILFNKELAFTHGVWVIRYDKSEAGDSACSTQYVDQVRVEGTVDVQGNRTQVTVTQNSKYNTHCTDGVCSGLCQECSGSIVLYLDSDCVRLYSNEHPYIPGVWEMQTAGWNTWGSSCHINANECEFPPGDTEWMVLGCTNNPGVCINGSCNNWYRIACRRVQSETYMIFPADSTASVTTQWLGITYSCRLSFVDNLPNISCNISSAWRNGSVEFRRIE